MCARLRSFIRAIVSFPVCVDPVTRPALRGCLWQPSFPRSVTLRCSMLSALRGSNNRCPHCGGVERRSKNNEKPVYPVLLYHISINFSSAESPHFSTVYGFCRKKFEKNLKNGLTYTACSAMMWIQRKSGTPQGRLKGEKNEKIVFRKNKWL